MGRYAPLQFASAPQILFQLTSFNSFVSSDFANFSGFRMGLNYNHRLRFGMGLLTLDGNAVVSAVSIREGIFPTSPTVN